LRFVVCWSWAATTRLAGPRRWPGDDGAWSMVSGEFVEPWTTGCRLRKAGWSSLFAEEGQDPVGVWRTFDWNSGAAGGPRTAAIETAMEECIVAGKKRCTGQVSEPGMFARHMDFVSLAAGPFVGWVQVDSWTGRHRFASNLRLHWGDCRVSLTRFVRSAVGRGTGPGGVIAAGTAGWRRRRRRRRFRVAGRTDCVTGRVAECSLCCWKSERESGCPGSEPSWLASTGSVYAELCESGIEKEKREKGGEKRYVPLGTWRDDVRRSVGRGPWFVCFGVEASSGPMAYGREARLAFTCEGRAGQGMPGPSRGGRGREGEDALCSCSKAN
jgi:hypothetical protein